MDICTFRLSIGSPERLILLSVAFHFFLFSFVKKRLRKRKEDEKIIKKERGEEWRRRL